MTLVIDMRVKENNKLMDNIMGEIFLGYIFGVGVVGAVLIFIKIINRL